MRAHLEHIAKITGRQPEALVAPPFPERLAYLWYAFLELNGGRQYLCDGAALIPLPLTYEAILAWVTLMQRNLRPWEVRAIKALDAVWLRAQREDASDE